MTRLAGRRALVTGGGGAIGRASCLSFAREGAAVAVVDVVGETAEQTVDLIRAAGGRAVAVVADVGVEAQVEAAVAQAGDALGGLDTLFDNAGIMPHQDRSFLDADLGLCRRSPPPTCTGLCCAASTPCPTCGPLVVAPSST